MCDAATRNHIGRIRRRNEMALHADEFVIRPLISEDAETIAAIESRCDGASKWGEAGYRSIGADGIIGWAAARENIVMGFILVRVVADEIEILNLAVEPDVRRKGIAGHLLTHAIEEAKRADVKHIYLEVRETNSAARGLYSAKGFIEQGRRKKYYTQPVVDALLLVFSLH
jgi:[ribosomal protein S18]-alanine N-acetyltransferase